MMWRLLIDEGPLDDEHDGTWALLQSDTRCIRPPE